jgi:hypothetical protein
MAASARPGEPERNDHEKTVRDAVANDHLLPERLGIEVRMVGLRTDGRRIRHDVRDAERIRARDLRKPLVPAGRQAEAGAIEPVEPVDGIGNIGGSRSEIGVLVVPGRHREV